MPIEVDSITYVHKCEEKDDIVPITHTGKGSWVLGGGEGDYAIKGCPFCLEPLPEFDGFEAAKLGLEAVLRPPKRRRPRLPALDPSTTLANDDALDPDPLKALAKGMSPVVDRMILGEEPLGPGSGPYAILWGLPNWKTPRETVLTWLKENNIGDERAERVALLLARKKGRRHSDPWEAFQKLVLPKLGP